MAVLLIVNPVATSTTDADRRAVEAALASRFTVVTAATERSGHAQELAAEAIGNYDAVFVLGGDGTLNEAANALAHTSMPLGALPGGSTSVFARSLGESRRPEEAAHQVADALASGRIIDANLGRVGDRYFLFNAGVGLDAAVVEAVETQAHRKRRWGQLAFAAAAATTLRRDQPAISLTAAAENCSAALVQNTRPYTFVGPRPLDFNLEAALDADLAVTAVTTTSSVRLLALLASGLASGRRLARSRDLVRLQEVTSLTVTSTVPVAGQADGALLGRATAWSFTSDRRALRIIDPGQK